jgi:small GTP-binding protein
MLENKSSDEELEPELGESGDVPDAFLCPISRTIMKDPVIVKETGQTYERKQIEEWFKEHNTDPLTNKQLKSLDLIWNYALRSTIEDFKKKRESRSRNSVYISKYHHGRNELKHAFKVSVIGPAGVGKTCLIRKMCYGEWDENYKLTLQLDIENVVVKIGDSWIKLSFWDTVGQERYNSLIFSHIRGSDAVLTVFDLSNDKTLKDAKKYLQQAPTGDALLFLVGSKADLLKDKDLISANGIAQRFADNNSMIFFSTSAKNSTNTEKLCQEIARSLSAMSVRKENSAVTKMRLPNGVRIKQPNANSQKTCCIGFSRCGYREVVLRDDWSQEPSVFKDGD